MNDPLGDVANYDLDVADLPVEAGSDDLRVHCISCGASSPTLHTDFGIRTWVAVHLCNVPTEGRTWFTTPMGEEVGDRAI